MAMAANLVLVDWASDEPQLWSVVLNSIPLVQGTTVYTLPPNILQILDIFIRVTTNGVQNDRIIYGVSRSEYAAYPNKALQAYPTVYWADRVVPIQLSLYPTPDQNGPYVLWYYAIEQDQDAVVAAGAQLDTPYRAMSAFVDGLTAKLALSYPPPPPVTVDMLDKVAARSYAALRAQESENVSLFITPGLQSYFNQ